MEFYSVVTYESGLSFVMIDLDPSYYNARQPQTNDNIFSRFHPSKDGGPYKPLYTDIGFACVYNYQVPDNPSRVFTRCYIQDQPPPASQIYNSIWEYDLFNTSLNQTVSSDELWGEGKNLRIALTSTIITCLDISPPASVDADILAVPLLGNQTALVFLNLDNTIGISIGQTYTNLITTIIDPYNPVPSSKGISSPSAIPFPHIAATSPGVNSMSSIIYMYCQINGTAIAEVTYNVANDSWGAGPIFISFAEFFNSSGGYMDG